MPRYLLRQFVSPGQALYIARVEFRPGWGPVVHTHDFAEVFWIERGRGIHWINGRRMKLSAGDLVLMRPADEHGFSTRDSAGFTLVNVAFAANVLGFLKRRYFSQSNWPWEGGLMPAQFVLSPAQLRRMSEWSYALAAGEPNRLQLEWFLLNLLRILAAPVASSSQVDSPAWLEQALIRFREPQHFSLGPMELARLADRCPEHLNRVVRKLFGKTTTDMVNDLRMDHAGRQLLMTGRSILDIALDCGLGNLGYFYRLFHKRFGLTPRQFRMKKHAVVR